MKVQVIRSNRKTIGLEVRADESVILRAPAVDEISDVEWKSILELTVKDLRCLNKAKEML